jgi:hypothetical protein
MKCLLCNEELGFVSALDRRPSLRHSLGSDRKAGAGEFMCPRCWDEVVGDLCWPRLDDSVPLDCWSYCGLFYEDPTPGRIVGRC